MSSSRRSVARATHRSRVTGRSESSPSASTAVSGTRFPAAPSRSASVTVKLHYEHAPRGQDEERVWVTFFSERRFLRAGEQG